MNIRELNQWKYSVGIIFSLPIIIYVLYQLCAKWNFETQLPIIQISLQYILLINILMIDKIRHTTIQVFIKILIKINNIIIDMCYFFLRFINKNTKKSLIRIVTPNTYNFKQKKQIIDLVLDDEKTIKLNKKVQADLTKFNECIDYNGEILYDKIKILTLYKESDNKCNMYDVRFFVIVKFILKTFLSINNNLWVDEKYSHTNIGTTSDVCIKYFTTLEYNNDSKYIWNSQINNPEYIIELKMNRDTWRSRLGVDYINIVIDFKNNKMYSNIYRLNSNYRQDIDNYYKKRWNEYITRYGSNTCIVCKHNLIKDKQNNIVICSGKEIETHKQYGQCNYEFTYYSDIN